MSRTADVPPRGGAPATAAMPPVSTHPGTGLFVLKGFIMDRTRGTHCAKGPLLWIASVVPACVCSKSPRYALRLESLGAKDKLRLIPAGYLLVFSNARRRRCSRMVLPRCMLPRACTRMQRTARVARGTKLSDAKRSRVRGWGETSCMTQHRMSQKSVRASL